MWIDFFFGPSGRNYWKDPVITKLRKQGHAAMDTAKRNAVYKQAFDRINEQTFMVPVSTIPSVIVHTKEIRLKPGGVTSFGVTPGDIFWK